MVRNESVRFGRHIDIEVSYKILQLKIPKLVLILHYLACFQKRLFGGNFEQKHPCLLGVKIGVHQILQGVPPPRQEVFGIIVSEVIVCHGLCGASLQSHIKRKKPCLLRENVKAHLEFT
jgi:hypothetical protein